jgi:hypothetical protein
MITLVPESERVEGSSIVIGFLDVGTSMAELRPYDVLEERHRARFGSLPFDLDRGQFDAFIDDLKVFLVEEGMTIQTVSDAEHAEKPAARSSNQPAVRTVSVPGKVATSGMSEDRGGGLGIGAVVFGVIVGVAIGIVMMLLLK